ncbi:neuron navigator 1-like isoform X3 [Clupea harengus]|uniref:Neuron navigator 1 n=1 Tax=Clupea harengus TaxID=7950 RepID=A0A6P8FFC4_CLUHA|nr:neuron navigator 1-like isoform X3 [Clupea harengus]
MSGGVNMKTMQRAQAGSGIPLPRSKLSSPKPEPKNPTRGLPRPTTQIPSSARAATSSSISASPSSGSSSSSSSSKDLLRDTTLRTQHMLLRGGLPAPRGSSKVHVKPQGVRSAFSSPQVRRKEAPRSKDTLEVCGRADNLQFSNDNQNFLCGNLRPQPRKTDNSPNLNSCDLPRVLDEGDSSTSNASDMTFPSYKSSNNNLRHAPDASATAAECSASPEMAESSGSKKKRMRLRQSASSSFSDEEMYTPEDLSPSATGPETLAPWSPAAPPQEDPRSVDLLRGKQTARVNMATVPPFRLQIQGDISSLDEFSDSSDSIEVCCEDLSTGRMPGGSPTSRVEPDSDHSGAAQAQTAHSQGEAKGPGSMAARRGKSGLPQSASRSELRVYKAGGTEGRLPVPTNLRKQKSLTNLCVLTDAEKKMHLYQPKWSDDMAKPGQGYVKTGKPKDGGGGAGRGGGGGGGGHAPLSRNLSKSEHSLCPGKSKSFSQLVPPSNLTKPSRLPRGPYAEVKPISKAQEAAKDSKSDDEILTSKAKVNGGKGATSPSGAATNGGGKGQEGDKSFVKVDPELVVTVLGDLEQLLFSQMLDPESQRKRTVQNVLDLRQNLEDTMSSLRGAQLSHSCLESSVCYDSDETNARSISSLSNRSSPLSWRQGQSSPRLQAGDAPSSTGSPAAHTKPLRVSSRFSQIHHIQLIEGVDDELGDLKSDYLGESNLKGKSLNGDEEDDDDVDVEVDDDDLANGWDESSSISSGLSDGSDNLSSEEFNAGSSLNSLPTTPIGSRRNSAIVLRTDAEKRSLVESGLSWYGEEAKALRRSEGGYDTGSLKTETSTKWKKSRTLDGGGGGGGGGGGSTGVKGELRKPQTLSQHGGGGLKKGRNPPVGVTSPITHTSQSMLKVAASKIEEKAVDKAKLAVKNSGLQRSCSDAGKERGENRKPPSGLVRPSAGSSFGYKKPIPTTGTATVMTAGGTAISGGSATVGKIPKSSGIPGIKPAVGGGRKTSLDVSNSEQGFLSPNARSNIQYRSLPRPAKSSALSLVGARPGGRPVSSTIDIGTLSVKTSSIPPPSRLKEPGSGKSAGRASLGGNIPVNQTDREKEKARAKAVVSDSECGEGSVKSTSSTCSSQSTVDVPSSKLQGLRHPSIGKFSDHSSPTPHRLSSNKSMSKPVQLDNLSTSSADSGVGSIQDKLPPRVPPYSKLQDLAGLVSTTPSLTPSPAPLLNVNTSDCFSNTSMSRSSSGSPLLYPRLSGLHRSMESLPLQMSVSPAGDSGSDTGSRHEDRASLGGWSTGSRSSLSITDSAQRDRNTLPKKGLSQYISSKPEDDSKDRRHSHTIMSLTESQSPPQLPSPISLPLSSCGKGPLTNVVAPSPGSGTPRMTRSNSIPAHDAGFELYTASPLGSTLSLVERPKSMIRSGSFRDRDPGDDVHGSMLSLASSVSSNYSSAEERIQGEQIRKLRRELENSQEKVANLTNQLSANANLVAAFEQSLALMTTRLQSLSVTADQKDTELQDMRYAIEGLQTKNQEAQEVIHVALNSHDGTPQELGMRRQNSCESISSLNSNTSHSSIGSLKEQEAKKKKKKSWLRSSFNKAFSIKKGSKTGSFYSDIEEIATPDSSAPNSPKLVHEGGEDLDQPPEQPQSATSSIIFETSEENENDEKAVSDLRSELWQKEMKLTDIRLEALSSAHQLEQLREAMNNMQSTVENLKAENDQLKTGTPITGPSMSTSQPSGLSSLLGSSPQRSMNMSLTKSFSLSLNECSDPEITPLDMLSLSTQRDDISVRVVVRMDQTPSKEQEKQQNFYIGSVRISAKTDWQKLDKFIMLAFKDYISKVDPAASMGLSTDSIHSYDINQNKRVLGAEPPESAPASCLGKGPCCINVSLKGLREKCVDSLVFETLVPRPMLQHYISLLLKHRRLIFCGPSGTGKTYLTTRLADYLLERSGQEATAGATVTFNMHDHSCKDLQLYLSNLANQIDRETSTGDIPLVIMLDDISDASAISELVNSALTCKYHKCPYIIGTTNQCVKMASNHGLHLSFRMVTFSNNVEPANGFLVRYLHRKLIESENESTLKSEELSRVLDWVPKLWYHLHTFLEKHSTSDFLIGPCFFLSCPVTVEEFRPWFIDLWNQSIIPYLQEGAKDGQKIHRQRPAWEDPVEWVRDTLPWPSAQQDQAKLFHLPPPTVDSSSSGQLCEERVAKETQIPSSLESDPLMAMLLKLQESANFVESPEGDLSGEPNFQATL